MIKLTLAMRQNYKLQSNSFYVYILLVLVSSKCVASMELIVDSALIAKEGNSYPNIAQALSALLSNSRLIDSENIITLKANSAGSNQYFPDCANQSLDQYALSTIINGSSSEGGSLQIVFENAPQTIEDSNLCTQLPVLVFSRSSCFHVMNLYSVNIIGMNIIYQPIPNTQAVADLDSLTFSACCFNKPGAPSDSENLMGGSLYFRNLSVLLMRNSMYIYDSKNTIMGEAVQNVILDNFIFFTPKSDEEGYLAAFTMMNSFDSNTTRITINNLKFQCTPETIVMPGAFSLQDLSVLSIFNMSISDCDFNGVTFTNKNLFYISRASALTVQGVVIHNMKFGESSFQTIFRASTTQTAVFSNFSIINLYTSPSGQPDSQLVYFADEIQSTYDTYHVEFSRWNIKNCSISSTKYLISVAMQYDSNALTKMIVEDCNIADSILTWKSAIVYFKTPPQDTSKANQNTTQIVMRNISVLNTFFSSSTLAQFNHLPLAFITAVEPVHVEVIDLNLSGVTLIQSSIIQTEGLCTYISKVNVENATFRTSSSFFSSITILSSVTMSDSAIKSVKLEDNSQFIGVNFAAARMQGLDSALDGGEKGTCAETRPFMIYNCDFDSIEIVSNSYLLVSTNPMVIIQQNSFTNNWRIVNSGLLKLGSYPFFHSPQSYFYQTGRMASYPVFVCTFAENTIFQNHPELGEIYRNARSNISKYDPENYIFFIWVSNNTICDIHMTNTPQLMKISEFKIDNGTIAVLNNKLQNIFSSNNMDLISCSAIQRGIAALNAFSRINVAGYAYSLNADEVKNLLFESNSMVQTQELSMCSISSADCRKIMIRENLALNVDVKQIFMGISCELLEDTIVVQGSVFENVVQTNTPGVISEVNFISLRTKKISPIQSSIVFQNDTFSNITVLDMQGFTQSIYQSSLVFILSLNSEAHFNNNVFNRITVSPKGGILTVSLPVISFSNCEFYDLFYGNVNGAIHAICETLSIRNCSFLRSQSLVSDGAGIFKLTNYDPSNVTLKMDIQNSTMKENIAPYGTLLYVEGSAIILSINGSDISNNQVTGSNGVITLFKVLNSNVTITHSNFEQRRGYLFQYPHLKVFCFENSGRDVHVYMSDLLFDVAGNAKGTFISISSGQYPVNLKGERIIYSAGADSSFPQFGLFEGNNFEATFKELHVNNISLGPAPLFTVTAITTIAELQNIATWHLNIIDSSFHHMELLGAFITVSSENNVSHPLDNLSITLENTIISHVNWLASSSTAGIVSSSTHQLGRSPEQTDFAISITSCTIAEITGVSGLIINTVETMFDSVVLIMNSRFSSIISTGPGAIINPATERFPNNTNEVKENIFDRKRNHTFKITESSFENISSTSGALLYWNSIKKGIFISSERNNFTNIKCSGNGGLIFAQYKPADLIINLLPIPYFKFISENDFVLDVSGVQNGGIIYLDGLNQLFDISFANAELLDIACSGNGGVGYVSSPYKQKGFILKSPSHLLYDFQLSQMGTINITGSHLANITTKNGGIVYEKTPNDSLILGFNGNTLENVVARERGGALYLTDPIISIKENIFKSVSAKFAGTIIYSISDKINLDGFNNSNVIAPAFYPLASFAPTNLLISFISRHDGSTIALEYENGPPYNPIVPNMTSYSLSEYQIHLSLIYNGSKGFQFVYDESNSAIISLNFSFAMAQGNQNYVGSDCSNSTCTVIAATQTLRGLAGDLILVNATYRSDVYHQFQQFYIRLRSCLPGEINNTFSGECTYCKPGTYSLIPNDSKCYECPIGATCAGGSTIITKAGFHRSLVSQTALHVLNCNDSGARCLAGVNNLCSTPFMGPVCLQCNIHNGYLMSAQSGNCLLCPSKNTVIAIAILLLAASIVYQLIMTFITFKENKLIYLHYQMHKKGKEIKPGQLLVIFSTYIQIASIVESLSDTLNAPLQNATNVVGNPYSQVLFSLQCVYLFSTPDPFNALQFQVLAYVLSPLVKILLAIIFELFRNLIVKNPEGHRIEKSVRRVGTLVVVLILLEQPGIVGILTKYLTCTRLDPLMDQKYIKTYNLIRCDSDDYQFFAKLVVIPALLFWAFVVPLAIFAILYKIRRKLFASKSLRIILGNFYNSYSEKSFYWGVVIIVFKLTIFILNSVISSSPILKGVIFIMIIHLYFHLLRIRSPYPYKSLYLAEKFCCIAYMTMLALAFIRLSTEVTGIQYACGVLIYIAYFLAGGYILLNVFLLYLKEAQKFIRNRKEKKKQSKISMKTMEVLRLYHQSSPSHVDRYHRRAGIFVPMPDG